VFIKIEVSVYVEYTIEGSHYHRGFQWNWRAGAKVVLGVRRKERLQKLAHLAVDTYGQIDVLVNNAGIMPISRLHELKICIKSMRRHLL
jgi:NADP-dependent 3-hydroxy acid dehydrogenase YdfG